MRELVCLSAGKLRQFRPTRRAPRTGTLRPSTPVGEIDIDSQAPDAEQSRSRHVDRVDRHLNQSARWYSEPGLRPGQWVQFEAPLRCITLNGSYRNLVLFSDPAPGEDPGHEREADCRLLMHGSAHHLLGLSPVPVDGPPLESHDGGSSAGATVLTRAGLAVEALDAAPLPPSDPSAPVEPTGADAPQSGLQSLLAAIDRTPALRGTAVWMRGLARVTVTVDTASGRRCLVASPLTVEVAHDLPSTT